MDPVLNAAANTAEDYPGGITAMAKAIGKTNKFSLMHELAQSNGAKLGLRDAVKMVRRSKDARILNAFAAECGYQPPLPLPGAIEDGSDVMRDLAHTAKEFADVVHEVSERTADNDVSSNDLVVIERESSELVAAIQTMLAHLRAKHEEAKPRHLRAA